LHRAWKTNPLCTTLDSKPRGLLSSLMPELPRLLLVLAALGSFARAADEDANLQHFRDIAETRRYSLGHPVAPKLTPDGRTVIYLRGGSRDPVLRLYEFPLPSGPERELLTPAQLIGAT